MIAFFFVTHLVACMVATLTGVLDLEIVNLAAMQMPALALGTVRGHRGFHRTRSETYRRVTLGVLALIGVITPGAGGAGPRGERRPLVRSGLRDVHVHVALRERNADSLAVEAQLHLAGERPERVPVVLGAHPRPHDEVHRRLSQVMHLDQRLGLIEDFLVLGPATGWFCSDLTDRFLSDAAKNAAKNPYCPWREE
jgi:hypothetical protein